MSSKLKILRFIPRNINNDNETKSSYHFYNSKSFFIRYYAYLPFIYSLKKAKFNKSSQVLDIGCSDGPFLPSLNYYAKKITAIDISEDLVKKSKKLTDTMLYKSKKISLLTSDGLALPFKDECFNLVFCLEVLEHVKNPSTVIEEIYRVLKKNGVFICTIPVEIGPSLLIREIIGKITKFNRPHYTRKELIRNAMFRKPGFRSSDMSHKNFDWRLIKKEVQLVFEKVNIEFIPIKILKDFNPLVLIKSVKES